MDPKQLEELKQKHKELSTPHKSGGNDFLKNFINVEFGQEQTIRILPWKDKSELFYKEYSAHRWNERNYSCLKDNGGKCPICEVYFALYKTGVAENIAIAKKIRARKKYWMNCVERESDTVKILSCGIKLFEVILSTIVDEEYGDITDLEKGFDYKIKKVKAGEWPDYTHSNPSRKESPAGTAQDIDRYMGSLHDVHGMIKYGEYEEMERIAAEVISQSRGVTLNAPDISANSSGSAPLDLTQLLKD